MSFAVILGFIAGGFYIASPYMNTTVAKAITQDPADGQPGLSHISLKSPVAVVRRVEVLVRPTGPQVIA